MSTNTYVDMCEHVQACTHVPVYAGQVQAVLCHICATCRALAFFLRFGVGKERVSRSGDYKVNLTSLPGQTKTIRSMETTGIILSFHGP